MHERSPLQFLQKKIDRFVVLTLLLDTENVVISKLIKVVSSLTKAIFGKRALHHVFVDDYVSWAGEMLVQGYDSSNLRILAGLDQRNSIVEAETYFLRSIKELNIEEPAPKTAIPAYACEIAQQIIDGQFPSSQQAVQALYQIWWDTGWDVNYVIWLQIYNALIDLHRDGFTYMYPSATLENFDAIVKQEAARFIAEMAI